MKTIGLNTAVTADMQGFRLGYNNKVLLMGSCFTENMGQKMESLHFGTMLNPFGILYNPLSMAEAMRRSLENCWIDESVLVNYEELWHSWLHHGAFSRRDRQECLVACNERIAEANRFLESCDTIILTFGSAWCYRLKENGMVVANCHKVPASNFEKTLLTVDEIVEIWKPLVQRLREKEMRILFTISPVRHWAYGAHGNQLGKAVLFLAVERLMQQEGTYYFPAYEIVMDELRDYRFFADDMLHPSPLAEKIVWQRFQESCMDRETISRCEQIESENKKLAHRIIHN